MRRWQEIKDQHGGWPLPLLIFTGIGLTIAGGATVAYLQAEVLTAPGESVWSTLTSAQLLEIVRTSTFALGAIGGVAALLMAYRRQKLNHATHQHELAKHNATHQLEIEKQLAARVAGLHDRYTKSVEQLANDRASIRLGAVHAIEALAADWLAIDNHRQRQVCVNLLCSYLGSLDEPRSESSIQNILEEDEGADEAELRAESKAAAERLWEDRSVRRAILEALSDTLVADYQANRDPVGVDLRKATFKFGLDLRNARLARLPLSHARLTGQTLDGADLTGANLQSAILVRANLNEANLTDADLSDAHLYVHTYLEGAKLVRANLRGAHLEGAHLDSADLTDANLHSAHLEEAHLENAILDGADCRRAILDGADCRRAILDGADLTNARLVRTQLSTAKLAGAILINADLTDAKLPSTFKPASLKGAILTRGCQTMNRPKQIATPDEWRTEARRQFGRKRIPDFTWTPDVRAL